LRSQYRKDFKETGVIPAVLLGQETRGCKTTLLPKIQQRFVELNKASEDKNSQYFCPVKERTLTYLQSILEAEFEQSINYHQLYTFSKSKGFKKLLNGDVAKAGV